MTSSSTPSRLAAQRISRRQFIRITATASMALASGGLLALGQAQPAQAARVHETRLLLGSVANLTLISADPDRARAAIQAAFERMAALEVVFSRFRPTSQISRLNVTGCLTNADPALTGVLRQAIAYGELTSGAFDVTIEPVLALYRASARGGSLPPAEAVTAARQRVDYRQIRLDGADVRFAQPDMAVTLDGIAKGYVIDQGVAALAEHGFAEVLVELGGDMLAQGQAGPRPWQVAIQQPDAATGTADLVAALNQRALATSGDYMQPYSPDRRLHHIMDPASGVSPLELSSASVSAATACDADALATAVMIMGAQAGLALIERLPGCAALVIGKDGTVQHTAGFPLTPA